MKVLGFFVIVLLLLLGYFFLKSIGNKKTILAQDEEQPSKLVVYQEDKPVIEIQPAVFFNQKAEFLYEDIEVNESIRNNIYPLIQRAPDMLSHGKEIVQDKLVIVLKPELMKGIKEGNLIMMPAKDGGFRLNVINANGKEIVGQGKIQMLRKIDPSKIALGIFNVLAVVTAQKFLSDINKHLELISKEVKDIKEWLKDERYGKIFGNLNYMKNIYPTLSNKGLSENEIMVYFNSIEEIERECDQIVHAIEYGWERPFNNINNVETPKYRIANCDTNLIINIKAFEETCRSYLLCMYVRMVAAKLFCALPVDRDLAFRRIEDIKKRMIRFADLSITFEETVQRKIKSLKDKAPLFNKRQTVLDACRKINIQLSLVNKEILKTKNEIDYALSLCQNILEKQVYDLSSPMFLEVDIDKEKQVQHIRRILK